MPWKSTPDYEAEFAQKVGGPKEKLSGDGGIIGPTLATLVLASCMSAFAFWFGIIPNPFK